MPDSILDVLDRVQAKGLRTVPPTPGSDPPDYYRGQTFTRAQIATFARDADMDYETVRAGVVERGARVNDGRPSRAPSASGPDALSILDDVQGRGAVGGDRVAPGGLTAPMTGEHADTRSVGSRAFDAAFTPPEAVTRTAATLADQIDAPTLDRSPLRARLEGFAAGAVEGAASLLTPGDAVLTALGFGPLSQAVRGVRGGARAVHALQQGANVATVGRGVERVADAESLSEGAAGVAQMALGSAGTIAGRGTPPPQAAPSPRLALPAGARFVGTPDGRVAAQGTDIRMTQAPDGSFVRGVPAEYARRDVAGLLPEARTPIITDPPAGSVPQPRPDGSGVRARRAAVVDYDATGRPIFSSDPNAASVTRPVRGELGPGPRFHADASGNIATAEQANILRVLDTVQGVRGPDTSMVRSRRPAVLARDFDPTVPARESGRVRQYASDPAAVDAPLLNNDETRMLRLMREDLATFTPERGRMIHDPNDPGFGIYAHGGPGSPVGDDVRVVSEQRVSNAEIARAIDDLLAGKSPSNRLHTGALDAARGYLEGRPGYRGPTLPMDAIDEGGLAGMAAREASRGGEPAAFDDFEAFSAAFDDVAPDPRGEPGEAGFIAPQLAAHVAGGLGGAAAGAASGGDTQDRIKRGLLYGAAGAVAPALLRRPGAANAAGRVTSASRPQATMLPMPERGAAVPRVGRSGAPIANPMQGVDVFLGKFSNPLLRTGIEERLIANNGYADQRRGTISTREVGRFANQVRVDVERALPRGSAASAEVVTAYGRAAQETQRTVAELAAKVRGGDDSARTLLELERARADADVVLKSLMGMRAEAGRALGAFRFFDGVLDTGRVDLIHGAAQTRRDEAATFAAEFGQLPTDPLARYRWLQQQGKRSLWDKTRAYFYSSILSGVKTHERNILGNVFNAIGNTVAHPFAAGVDAARSAATGKPRDVLFSELPHGVAGAVAGVERGFWDALATVRDGVSPDALRGSLQAADVGKLDLPRVEFGGGGRNPFNWPGRALDSADVFFRSVARNTEMYEAAYTQAWREGRRGPALLDRMAALRAGQTPEGAALRENAEHIAARAVFQEKGGPVTSWLAQGYRIPGIGQAMTFAIPFLRTPGNILRQGLETSPVGFGMRAARQPGRVGRLAQGKAAAGSLAAGYLAWLAATGRLSGDGPRDATERARLMERGWRPNSIKLGDSWVSYHLLQPVSVQAAIIANGYEAWASRGADPGQVGDLVAQTMARSVNSFLEQSFLSGLFDVIEAIKDPERSAARVFGRTAHGLTPFAGFQRTIRDAMDPVVRRPRGVVEQVASGMPGLSETVQPRIGRFGQTITREGGTARRALDPFNVSSTVPDAVSDELARLGVSVSLPSDRINLPGGRALTRDESTTVQRRRGAAVRAAVERVIHSPVYQRLDDDARRDRLERAITQSRSRATAETRGALSIGPEPYDHPQYGRVQIVGANPNGTMRVSRVLPDGSVGGRQFIARAGDLQTVAD